jgi:hypothetical protein
MNSASPTGRSGPRNAAVRSFVAKETDDEDVRKLIEAFRHSPRETLIESEMSDFELANRVYFANRDDLDLIVWQTAAKERIRWLSVQLSDALDEIDRLKDEATHDLQWAAHSPKGADTHPEGAQKETPP